MMDCHLSGRAMPPSVCKLYDRVPGTVKHWSKLNVGLAFCEAACIALSCHIEYAWHNGTVAQAAVLLVWHFSGMVAPLSIA